MGIVLGAGKQMEILNNARGVLLMGSFMSGLGLLIFLKAFLEVAQLFLEGNGWAQWRVDEGNLRSQEFTGHSGKQHMACGLGQICLGVIAL